MGLGLGLRLGLGGAGVLGAGVAWFVSSSTGSDANDGRSAGTPLATFGALTSQPDLASGQTINLDRGSVWQEEFRQGSLNGLTIDAYGSGPKPIIDAGKNLTTGDFSLSAHPDAGVNTYQFAHVADTGAGGPSSTDTYAVWQKTAGGIWRILRQANSVANVQATPGSYFYAAMADPGGSMVLYVHPVGSINPTTDGEFSVSNRRYTLWVGDNCTVRNLQSMRALGKDSFKMGLNSTIENVDWLYAASHHCVINSGSMKGCTCNYGGNITWYHGDPSQESYHMEGCTFSHGIEEEGLWGGETGMVIHGTGGARAYLNGTMVNCTIRNNGPVGTLWAQNLVLEDNEFINIGVIFAGEGVAGTKLRAERNFFRYDFAGRSANTLSGTTTFASSNSGFLTLSQECDILGNKFYFNSEAPAPGRWMGAAGGTNTSIARIINNSFFQEGSLITTQNCIGFGPTLTNEFIFERNILDAARCFYLTRFSSVPDSMTLNGNLYHQKGGSGKQSRIDSTDYNTLADWQALGYDLNSIVINPGFVDPANGDFTTTGAGATAAAERSAGVEYYVAP